MLHRETLLIHSKFEYKQVQQQSSVEEYKEDLGYLPFLNIYCQERYLNLINFSQFLVSV